ncbi:MAG: PEP-CTERM-box response regulator transcription factor [Gammaproteobacteria bacterium]|nr:PEP-CTERM-box response regulator transcription factor [Gammaproteobacteria bacterium]
MTDHKRKLLIIEDDPGLQAQLRWCFEDCEVIIAGDRETGLEELKKHGPAVVTLDLGLPPDSSGTTEGFLALEQILEIAPHTKVVVVTGNNERENAMRAVALGASDFFYKPIDSDILGFIVNRSYRLNELEVENHRLSIQPQDSPLEGVITSSPEMLQVCRTIEKVAPSDATILVLGESGTGKELLARSLHLLSNRGDGPFVAINCAAIPENLLESELFGYEKGAFTGAVKSTPGKIEMASGGTLFLDEVGDMPMSLQAKLLRFLQERVIDRVGGRVPIQVDIRVVCATHKNLQDLIENQLFREDLYYRLSEISVRVPPLKERTGDVLLLSRIFLEKFSQQQGGKAHRLGKDALIALEEYPWPGNVRELENRIKRAVIMADHKIISASDLELGDSPGGSSVSFELKGLREDTERQAVMRALSHVNGKIAPAAELLGVSRPTLYDLIRKYELK